MAHIQDKKSLGSRSPVVGIFGHIDHGKSTLLDYIRKTNVVEKEAGGITQHLSAYEVVHKREDGREGRITFLDTPGHEAFSGLRTRGARVADIAILVVSGEDGVKPQTLEVYKHIQEDNTPYIVAITKMDKANADLDRTKQNLAEHGIYVEGYGGDIPVVPLSAKTGQGVDELLNLISLLADLQELKGDETLLGEGVIIEGHLDPKRGLIATAIVKNGTVSRGTFAVSGRSLATMRYILDTEGKMIDSATFSSPIQIVGWDEPPQTGSLFHTYLKKDQALAHISEHKEKEAKIRPPTAIQSNSEIASLPLIVKADTAGSLEAVENEIGKLSQERIKPQLILSGIGVIGEGDVKTALATPQTVIIGFNTKVEREAQALAERSGVQIQNFDIIYELTEKVAGLLTEREPKIEVEEVIGTAKVLKLFSANKHKQVLGGRVLLGKITPDVLVRIMRREAEIGHGRVRELQQSKTASAEVLEGLEFGAMIESKLEIAPGDVLEAIVRVTK